jgi:hypothetical protein
MIDFINSYHATYLPEEKRAHYLQNMHAALTSMAELDPVSIQLILDELQQLPLPKALKSVKRTLNNPPVSMRAKSPRLLATLQRFVTNSALSTDSILATDSKTLHSKLVTYQKSDLQNDGVFREFFSRFKSMVCNGIPEEAIYAALELNISINDVATEYKMQPPIGLNKFCLDQFRRSYGVQHLSETDAERYMHTIKQTTPSNESSIKGRERSDTITSTATTASTSSLTSCRSNQSFSAFQACNGFDYLDDEIMDVDNFFADCKGMFEEVDYQGEENNLYTDPRHR